MESVGSGGGAASRGTVAAAGVAREGRPPRDAVVAALQTGTGFHKTVERRVLGCIRNAVGGASSSIDDDRGGDSSQGEYDEEDMGRGAEDENCTMVVVGSFGEQLQACR